MANLANHEEILEFCTNNKNTHIKIGEYCAGLEFCAGLGTQFLAARRIDKNDCISKKVVDFLNLENQQKEPEKNKDIPLVLSVEQDIKPYKMSCSLTKLKELISGKYRAEKGTAPNTIVLEAN